MMESAKLSSSLEDYLKEIYILSNTREEVRVTDVSKELGISKPSVNRAMNNLKELGYIDHEHYGSIVLTEMGEKVGKTIYDTNKVVYRFLTEVLGVEEAQAREEAHLLEHDLSKSTKKKLKKLIKKKK